MPFAPDIAQQALVSCGRHCCICHKFCGTKMELHHIKPEADGGEDSLENCIPLCFDCHADVQSYNPSHPKGRKYAEAELKQHRDRWFGKVQKSGGPVAPPEYLHLDRVVFQRLREILPSRGCISFMRSHDYGGIFPASAHDDLWGLWRECDLPEFEFNDTDLEGLRGELRDKVIKLLGVLARETYPIDSPGGDLKGVPPEWRHEQPERYEKVVEEIHQLVAGICDVYDNLIRLGRRKLAI